MITAKIDYDLCIEGSKVTFRVYNPADENDVTYIKEIPLFDMVAEYLEYFKMFGTEQYKIDAEDQEALEELSCDLRDSLSLVNDALESVE